MKNTRPRSGKGTTPRNSCCGNGAFISVRVLPYGSRHRRTRTAIKKTVKA